MPNAAIERVAKLCLVDALELGTPCRFDLWVGHQLPFSSSGSLAIFPAIRRASPRVSGAGVFGCPF